MKKLLTCFASIVLIAGAAAFFFVNTTSSQSNRVYTGWNTNAAPIRNNYNVNGPVNTRPYVYSNANMAAANVYVRPRGFTESQQLILKLIGDHESVRALIAQQSLDGEKEWSLETLSEELKIEKKDLNGDSVPEYIIWSTFQMGFCGVSGNCDVWIYRKSGSSFENILHGSTVGDVITAKTRTRRFSDLVLTSHSGAHEVYNRTYKYNGTAYSESSCFIKSYIGPNGNILKQPRILTCR